MKYAAVLVENEIEQSFSNGEHSPRTTVFVEKLYYFDLLEKFLPVFPHKGKCPWSTQETTSPQIVTFGTTS